MIVTPPQIVGALLKKPGQKSHLHIPSLDHQETKIRGELYVENLGERRIVSIRMGWLWVEGTQMRLPLRALNLRQAPPSIRQPHILSLGFSLSNSQNVVLATFWVNTEPIYWSWVRAIAAELVRQTPFRVQRFFNFLEILTICPRGQMPVSDSPTQLRRRSRSELRCWPSDSTSAEKNDNGVITIIDDPKRRAKSEFRGWSSSNSSDDDVVAHYHQSISATRIMPKKLPITGIWDLSESSEGSDDSLLRRNVCRTISVDSVDSPCKKVTAIADTREQRIQRYKEARRRENEARSRRVLEEDARIRKARIEGSNSGAINLYQTRDRSALHSDISVTRVSLRSTTNNNNNQAKIVAANSLKRQRDNENSNQDKSVPLLKTIDLRGSVIAKNIPSEDGNNNIHNNNNNNNNINSNSNYSRSVNVCASAKDRVKVENERKSRTRERRCMKDRDRMNSLTIHHHQSNNNYEALNVRRKERLTPQVSTVSLVNNNNNSDCFAVTRMEIQCNNDNNCPVPMNSEAVIILPPKSPCEEDVARLLERCQRVDRYVPVSEKLTLFESLSKLGGRLARSTEDLGRTSTMPTPRGKKRATSLHDLNRGVKSVPVREMCRLFEGEKDRDDRKLEMPKIRLGESTTAARPWKIVNVKNSDAPCMRKSSRKKHFAK